MLEVQTIGALVLRLKGKELDLPPSRKTRALIAYLALSRASHSRQALCEMFWDIPDDPRASLRWSLSKLRPIVNAGGTERLSAERERVGLLFDDVVVDFESIRLAATDSGASREALVEAWQSAAGMALENCEIPNQPEFMVWLEQQRNELTRLRVEIARKLTNAPELECSERDRWAERWLQEAPFDPVAASAAVLARRQAGQELSARELQQRLTREFREAGLPTPDFTETTAADRPAAIGLDGNGEPLRQSIRFVKALDETAIAWASVGSSDKPPLLKAANWLSHLELDWEAPIWSPLFREFAKTHRLVRYDERGCGLSDWDVGNIDFENFVADLEVVADAAGLDRFPLLGISQGAAVSIEFAARFPERVSHLVLFGGYDAGWRHLAEREEIRQREAVMVLTASGWGSPNPAYRQIFSRTFMPDAATDELEWFDEFQRLTTSPANAVKFLEAFSIIDVRDRLAEIRCPTLVVHSRNDQRIPIASGRAMASRIPNARFASIESNNHLLLGREPASHEFVTLVNDFLRT